MRHLILIALAIPAAAMGQGMLYHSAADHAQNKGDTVEGAIDVMPSMGRFVVVYVQGGKRKQVATRKVWGFMNKGALYRIEPEGNLPVRLMAQGPIYYWENGLAHLRMQNDLLEASGISYGWASYLSQGLESEIVPAVFGGSPAIPAAERFRAERPEYATLLGQIGTGADLQRVRQLVVEYAVAAEEGRISAP